MKKIMQILMFVCIGVTTWNTAKAQVYDPLTVQKINRLIDNNGLIAIPDAPETWQFAWWNDETPKQLIYLFLIGESFMGGKLSGVISFTGFEKLQWLNCKNHYITELEVANCPELQYLNCSFNRLNKLDITNCAALEEIVCENNHLSVIDVSGCIRLINLDCSSNYLTEIDLTNNIQLQSLNCNSNYLTEIDLTNNIQLQSLNCGSTYITELDVSRCTQLQSIGCTNHRITRLDLTNCTQLRVLGCTSGTLAQLDITTCPEMYYFDCSNNRLTELEVKDFKKLEYFNCSHNCLTKLDYTGSAGYYHYVGDNQSPSLALHKNDDGTFSHSIDLNEPTFGNTAISYEDGVLTSTDSTIVSTSFTVKVIGHWGRLLTGTMNFNYSDVGIIPQEKEQLKIYPNPTTGELTITNYELQITNVEIFDVYGRRQKAEGRRQNVIDISNMKSGIYFVKIITDTGVIVKKVVKQ